jgi:hypothetical protein
MKLTLLSDVEPILSKSSDKNYHIRLGVSVTNTGDFIWPPGLKFKLIGLKKDLLAEYELKKEVLEGENTMVVWEFTNDMDHQDENKSNIEALVKVLKMIDGDLSSDDGFKLKIKCSLQERKLKFLSTPCRLDWE